MQIRKKLLVLHSFGLRQATEIIVRRSLFDKVFDLFEKFGIHVLPVHYTDPIPDTRELRRNLDRWYREWSFTGVDFNMKGQLNLLNTLRAYKIECDKLPSYEQVFEQGFGYGFGVVESCICF